MTDIFKKMFGKLLVNKIVKLINSGDSVKYDEALAMLVDYDFPEILALVNKKLPSDKVLHDACEVYIASASRITAVNQTEDGEVRMRLRPLRKLLVELISKEPFCLDCKWVTGDVISPDKPIADYRRGDLYIGEMDTLKSKEAKLTSSERFLTNKQLEEKEKTINGDNIDDDFMVESK